MSAADRLAKLQADVLTVTSDPHLEWSEARVKINAALNSSFQETTVAPGFERCPECGNLAMNRLLSCSTCGGR